MPNAKPVSNQLSSLCILFFDIGSNLHNYRPQGEPRCLGEVSHPSGANPFVQSYLFRFRTIPGFVLNKGSPRLCVCQKCQFEGLPLPFGMHRCCMEVC